jgi:hypothetical protein
MIQAQLYAHLDKTLVSVMGSVHEKKQIDKDIKEIARSLEWCLTEGKAKYTWVPVKGYGFQKMAVITYRSGQVEIRYDKRFAGNRKKASDRKFIMAQIKLTCSDKLDYSRHHETCLLVDSLLDQKWSTRDFHIRAVELALDTLDQETGRFYAKAMVPQRADLHGWECKKGYKAQKWLRDAEGQYYQLRQDNRQWHCYVHWYRQVPIWRIEFRANWKYLKPKGLSSHGKILESLTDLIKLNMRFMRPKVGDLPKAHRRFRQQRKHYAFTRQGFEKYLKWESFSTPAWLIDLRERLGSGADRYFETLEFPEIVIEGHPMGIIMKRQKTNRLDTT